MAFKKVLYKTETIEYTSPNDPNKTNPTVFVLGSITAEQKQLALAELIEYEKDDNGIIALKDQPKLNKIISYYKALIRYGLREVRNLEGYEWKNKVDDELINILIDLNLLFEIGAEIQKINEIGIEVKN